MEQWETTLLHLERESIDHGEQTVDITCHAVVFDPESDIPSERTSARGRLLARGCDTARLAELAWTPTRVRFKAKKLIEERLFEIKGMDVTGPDEVSFWLPSVKGDGETNSSDSHISAFPAFDAVPRV